MRRKKLMSDAESDELMLKHHPELFGGMTMDQVMDAALETVRQMSKDEKAILRARMLRSAGLIKTSNKPS